MEQLIVALLVVVVVLEVLICRYVLINMGQRYILNHCSRHGLWRTPEKLPTAPCPMCQKEM